MFHVCCNDHFDCCMTIHSAGMDPSPCSGTIKITAAVESDIESLIFVHKAAFANDNATHLMFKDEEDYTTHLRAMFKSQLPNPEHFITKAVNEDTELIVGWLEAQRVNYPDSEGEGIALKHGSSGLPSAEGSRSLRASIQEHSLEKRTEYLSRKKYIHIKTLVTHPVLQRRGIGSALLFAILSKAHQDQVPCWIESSPVAQGIYHNAGFRPVGSFEIDLREYNSGGMDGKFRWGPYEFTYMLRLPREQQ